MRLALLLALAAMTAAAQAQPVPEGIHSLVDGGPDICGRSAETVEALQAQLAAALAPLPGNKRFVAFGDDSNKRVWTFTTAAHPAHPAVACRSVTTGEDGSTYLGTELDCRSTRAKCDALYREFEALNRKLHKPGARR